MRLNLSIGLLLYFTVHGRLWPDMFLYHRKCAIFKYPWYTMNINEWPVWGRPLIYKTVTNSLNAFSCWPRLSPTISRLLKQYVLCHGAATSERATAALHTEHALVNELFCSCMVHNHSFMVARFCHVDFLVCRNYAQKTSDLFVLSS